MDRNEWLIPTFQLHVRGGVVFPSSTCRAAAGRPKSPNGHFTSKTPLNESEVVFKNSTSAGRYMLKRKRSFAWKQATLIERSTTIILYLWLEWLLADFRQHKIDTRRNESPFKILHNPIHHELEQCPRTFPE